MARIALKRQGGVCEICGVSPATEPHHVIYPAWGAFDTPGNLKGVCHECHTNEEAKRRPVKERPAGVVAAASAESEEDSAA